ncbi:VTT domain-containing protein [Salinirubellus salinus]|uniref:VTT domain-containing protein n=1 Tax=Salinirubellus salinus TaxID=1364945 RepID=A0A9E7R2W4_9EURY|nr:VTT domain-containing protein [Salinirubellus salinus]UWM53635.1 VTT domain-containing protein [Salinirubellus salinus]
MDRPTGTSLFTSRAARRGALVRVGLLVLVVAGAGALLVTLVPALTDPERLRAEVRAFGPYAPLAFVALQTVQVVIAPIPGQLLGGVAGYLFGGLAGSGYSLLGVALGSALAIGATRRFGRSYAERVLDEDVLARFDAVVDAVGEPGLFVMFLLPVFPDDALCFLAGLTEIPVSRLLVLVVVGRAPTFVLAAYLGGSVAESNLLLAGLLAATMAVLAVVGYRHREALVAAVEG